MSIGIVVIGRNEGERLTACLRSIANQDHPIVYVDSGSTDGSAANARSFGAEVVELDMSIPFTAARARNAGFERLISSHPDIGFVQFVDGDCVVDDEWLGTARDFLTHRRDVAVAAGRRREMYPDASLYNWLCDIEWNTPVGEAEACGGDALMRVEAFRAVGGYRDDLIAGEEPELCLRLRESGWLIWRLDCEMTRHDANIQHFGQWWRRTRRGGYAFGSVSWLHRTSAYGIWGKEVRRATVWAGVIPAVIVALTSVSAYGLFGLATYPLQITRMAVKRGPERPRNWQYAMFMALAKFAEFQGIAEFFLVRLAGRERSIIEYK